MATSYVNIYTRAITSFEDPTISAAYVANSLDFFKIMKNYLDNAIPLFTIPKTIQTKLITRVEPIDVIELFSGTGSLSTFVLSTTPHIDSYFNYLVEDVTASGVYDVLTNSATITPTPIAGTENVSIESYFCGEFSNTLSDREEKILSSLLVQCWAEKEKNFLLDIRRLLNDTDFKLSAESTTIREKGNWYNSIRENVLQEMKQYSWDLYVDSMNLKYNLSL